MADGEAAELISGRERSLGIWRLTTRMAELRRCAPVLVALGTTAMSLPAQTLDSPRAPDRTAVSPRHVFSRPSVPAKHEPQASAVEHRLSLSALVVVVSPVEPVAGGRVRLRIRRAPSGQATYAWDLDGSGRYATHTHQSPLVTMIFSAPGRRRVSVRVTQGVNTRVASLTLVIRSPARPVHARAGERSRDGERSRAGERSDVGKRSDASERSHVGKHGHAGEHAHAGEPPSRRAIRTNAPIAHAATDPAVRIADFSFAPGATTVHVGDTITWSNDGPSSHSATATDGSFDTGILSKGQNASHTFTRSGTFSYFCKIHPFMHGTIVVLASTRPTPQRTPSLPGPTGASHPAAPTPTGAAAPTPTATAPAAVGAERPSLPLTGLDLVSVALGGLTLAGLGWALRRASTRTERRRSGV